MNNVVYSTYILYADIYTVNYSIQLEHDDVIEVLPIERRTVWRNNRQAYKQWCIAGACLAQDNAYNALLTKNSLHFSNTPSGRGGGYYFILAINEMKIL